MIGIQMIAKPDLLLLDEPTSALDLSVQGQIVELLRGLQKRHKLAFLFVSHDLKVVRAMSHHIIVMIFIPVPLVMLVFMTLSFRQIRLRFRLPKHDPLIIPLL